MEKSRTIKRELPGGIQIVPGKSMLEKLEYAKKVSASTKGPNKASSLPPAASSSKPS